VFQGVFLYFAVTERLYALFHLVAFRGLRRGEAAGLPWTDVDLEGGTIRIRETRPDGDFDPDDPKSEYGDRAVTLDAMTVVALDAWRTAQDKEKEAYVAGGRWTDLTQTHRLVGTGRGPTSARSRAAGTNTVQVHRGGLRRTVHQDQQGAGLLGRRPPGRDRRQQLPAQRAGHLLRGSTTGGVGPVLV
jgi:integrase